MLLQKCWSEFFAEIITSRFFKTFFLICQGSFPGSISLSWPLIKYSLVEWSNQRVYQLIISTTVARINQDLAQVESWSVWPDWAISESSRWQFSSKGSPNIVDLLDYLEKKSFYVQLKMLWLLFGFFNPTSSHTGRGSSRHQVRVQILQKTI